MNLTDRQCFLIAVALFGVSALRCLFLWRDGFRHHNRANYILLLAGFAFHTVAMFKRGFSLAHCPVNNLYEATTFIAWTILAAYLVVGLWAPLRFLGAFASPLLFVIGVFALMPTLDATPRGVPQFTGGWMSFHAALVLLAYGAFGLSSVAGMMYLSQEHDLRFHKLRAVVSLLPPIQRLEQVAGRLLAIGFILLTAGLVVGAIYLKETQGVFIQTNDPKIIWSGLVWTLYLGLLTVHWRFGQTGRRFIWGVVGSFVFVLLTFWGTNLLSPIHQTMN